MSTLVPYTAVGDVDGLFPPDELEARLDDVAVRVAAHRRRVEQLLGIDPPSPVSFFDSLEVQLSERFPHRRPTPIERVLGALLGVAGAAVSHHLPRKAVR